MSRVVPLLISLLIAACGDPPPPPPPQTPPVATNETPPAEEEEGPTEITPLPPELQNREQPSSPRAVGTLDRHNQVIVYGTSWCGACRQARDYFARHNIAFVDKDIDRDHAAAAEMHEKARRAGITNVGIPIIDFEGTIIRGFNVSRIAGLVQRREFESILGE